MSATDDATPSSSGDLNEDARLLPFLTSTETDGISERTLIRSLANERELIDASRRIWRRRGGPTDERRLRRLLADPSVRVVHDYLGAVTEIPLARRDAFWAGATQAMRASTHSSFLAAEFKNEAREHLLVLHEDC